MITETLRSVYVQKHDASNHIRIENAESDFLLLISGKNYLPVGMAGLAHATLRWLGLGRQRKVTWRQHRDASSGSVQD